MGKYNRGKFTVITVTRELKTSLEKAKRDDETYDAYLRNHLKLTPIEEIELHKLPKRQAKKLILDFVKANSGVYTSDIVEALQIVPWQIYDILHELKREGKVKQLDEQPLTEEDIFGDGNGA